MASKSAHAVKRQNQRDIPDNFINTVVENGEMLECKESTIFTDNAVKVVLNSDCKTIITVCKNNRNALFQLSERTKEKEELLLQKLKRNGKNDHVMCELAELYTEGSLGRADNVKALKLFQKAAKNGNSHAMCRIAELYANGSLGKPNQKLSDEWMQKAADRNNVFALAIIAQRRLNEYIKKYPKNSKLFRPSAPKREILNYLQRSADKGSTRAMWQLGKIHEEGYFDEVNIPKAIEIYVKAAKTGSPASLDSLHQLTLKSIFKKEDLEDILDNLTYLTTTSIGMALQLGFDQSLGKLGYNPIRGLKMIEEVALKEVEDAIRILAEFNRSGKICEENLILSQYWFNKLHDLYDESAARGNVNSLWKLGEIYSKGYINNTIDLDKAEFCFEETIEATSDPDEIFELGMFYLEGRLGDKPIENGLQMIKRAIRIWKFRAHRGNTNAYFYIGKIYYTMRSYKKAVKWLSKIPDEENITRLIYLAKIYLNNSCTERNIPVGLQILREILQLGGDLESVVDISEICFNGQILRYLIDLLDENQVKNVNEVVDKRTKYVNEHSDVNELVNKRTNVNLQTLTNKQVDKNVNYKRKLLETLAEAFERRNKLGNIDYESAAKYYHQLFVEYESVEAAIKLVKFYNKQNLPEIYHNSIKNLVSKSPMLLETDFNECVSLLAEIYYKENDNIEESFKWLTLVSYINTKNKIKRYEEKLKKLSNLLNMIQKEKIIVELVKMVENIKIKSPVNFRVLSRILGDIFDKSEILNRDIDKAIYWYKESSLMNNSKASFALAEIFQNDKKDIDESIKWYKLSARQGNQSAIEALKKVIQNDEKIDNNNVSSFLEKYTYRSTVEDSELNGVKPFKNLKSYPQTFKEKIEIGKSCLEKKEDKQSVLNAAYWFREAWKSGSVNAGLKLCSMYHSGVMGTNLISVVHNLQQDILGVCCYRLKCLATNPVPMDFALLFSLLKNLSLLFESYNLGSDSIRNKLGILMKSTDCLDYEVMAEFLSELDQVRLELSSKNSNYKYDNFSDDDE